jgi:small ligand-binding sensory domain FIST
MQPQKKALVVAGDFRVGDEVQFHVRDGTAALNDLDLMVQRMQTERLFVESSLSESMATTTTTTTTTNPIPVAAVQVSCVARGRSLFGKANADVDHIHKLLGNDGAVAGFYANGEVGLVGIAGIAEFDGSTFLHGFTLVAAILCDSGGVTRSSFEGTLIVDDKVEDSWG